MQEQRIILFILTGLYVFAGLGTVMVIWSGWKKLFRQARAMLLIDDPDCFIRAAKDMLDTRFSKDPRYQPNAQLNRLELYQVFNQWVTAKVPSPIIIMSAPVMIGLLMGAGLIRAYKRELGMGLTFWTILAGLAIVTICSALVTISFKRNIDILKILDRRFYEFVEPDRVALSQRSYEEQAVQAYRLNIISASPQPRSDHEVLSVPKSMAEASLLLRNCIAFLIGLGFFICMILIGLAVLEVFGWKDDSFAVFPITGLIGIGVIWIALMVYWSNKKKRRAMEREQAVQPAVQPPYPAPQPVCVQYPQQPYPPQPAYPQLAPSQQPLPQAASLVCPNCHRMITLGVDTCPYCGHQPPRPTNA